MLATSDPVIKKVTPEPQISLQEAVVDSSSHPFAKQEKKMSMRSKFRIYLSGFLVIVMVAVASVGYYLSTQQQDVRQKASDYGIGVENAQPAGCYIYAANDSGDGDTVFVALDPATGLVKTMNTDADLNDFKRADFESLEIDPTTNRMYTASSKKAEFYVVDGDINAFLGVHLVGNLVDDQGNYYINTEGLAFHPETGELWALNGSDGRDFKHTLFTIDPQTAKVTHKIQLNKGGLESLTWAKDENDSYSLYATQDKSIFVIDETTGQAERIFSDLKRNAETLGLAPSGDILIGYYDSRKYTVQLFNVKTKTLTDVGMAIDLDQQLDDVEGIAYSFSCPQITAIATPAPTASPSSSPSATPRSSASPSSSPSASASPSTSASPTSSASPLTRPSSSPTSSPQSSASPAASPGPTVEPIACGETGCLTDFDCEPGYLCSRADNGVKYCHLNDSKVKRACEGNPNTTTCCKVVSTPTPSPNASVTPKPSSTPIALACGASNCDSDDDCQDEYVCSRADNGIKYCHLNYSLTKAKCEANPSVAACCTVVTPTPTASPQASATPVAVSEPVVGCNDICVSNADCTNSTHICYTVSGNESRCRLATNVTSSTCNLSVTSNTSQASQVVVQQQSPQYYQPNLPSTLPQTGPEDWLVWAKTGLAGLGVGLVLLLLL